MNSKEAKEIYERSDVHSEGAIASGYLEASAKWRKQADEMVRQFEHIISHASSMDLNGIGTTFSRSFSDLSKEALFSYRKFLESEEK